MSRTSPHRLGWRLLLVASVLLTLSCGDDGTSPAGVDRVTVSAPRTSLYIGETMTVSAAVLDAGDEALEGRRVTWSSTMPLVATVDSLGKVTALAAGSTRIQATAEGKSGEVGVTVSPAPVATVTASADSVVQLAGDSTALTAQAFDVLGRNATVTVTWASDDTSIATVSAAGMVHGRRPGRTMVRVGVGTVADSVTVVVRPRPATTLRISPDTLVVQQFQAAALTAELLDDLGAPVQGGRLVWTSFAPTAATVDSTGRVTALTVGTWRVMAESGALVDTAFVRVTAQETAEPGQTASIEISPAPARLRVGDSLALQARTFDSGRNEIAGRTLAWSSDDAMTVSVSPGGTLHAHQSGAAWVRVVADGRTMLVAVIVADTAGATFRRISTGAHPVQTNYGVNACGVTLTGALYCWGDVGSILAATSVVEGCPNGTCSSIPMAVRTPGSVDEIDVGGAHACLISAGDVYCWGLNESVGATGTETPINSEVPVPSRVTLPGSARSVHAAFARSCALLQSGQLYCWGANFFGGLGDGTTTDRPRPVLAGSGIRFRAVTLGQNHGCGLREDSTAVCWGRNDLRELGVEQVSCSAGNCSTVPVAVSGGRRFAAIAAGERHTCGLEAAGAAWCWGSNVNRELASVPAAGTPPWSAQPVRIEGAPAFTAIRAGGARTCGRSAAGEWWCWGSGAIGLEDDDFQYVTPTRLGADVVELDLGVNGCGLEADGTAMCWGGNGYGQLGNGSVQQSSTPVRISRPR